MALVFSNSLRSQLHNRLVSKRALSLSSCLKSDDVVTITVESNGIRRMVMNRPAAKNALSLPMMEKIGASLVESNTDNNTKIVTISATGNYFSSGNDLKNWTGSSLEEIKENSLKCIDNFLYCFMDCRKPIIAMVNGGAVGAGATMLAHCDLILASEKAFFITPFPAMGIVPELGSSKTFPDILGLPKANDMLLFGHKMTGEEAFQRGFVSKLIPANVFPEECDKLVGSYAKLPLEPLIQTKELIRGSLRTKLKKVVSRETDYVLQFIGGPVMNAQLEKFFKNRNMNNK